MAWHEPNNSNNKKDNNEGPPDLDEALKKLQAKLSQLFGGKSQESRGGTSKLNIKPSNTLKFKFNFGYLLLIIFGLYVLSGIYIVGPADEAVVTRFGRYIRTEGAGPHWIPRFIENAEVVNVMRIETTTHGGEMLTMDENIVDAKIAVQYRISNARDYLFSLTNPDESLKQVSESALRAVVGQSSLNEILTTGRAEITNKIRHQVQAVLDSYKSGLQISDLAMQQTKPPSAVQDAFDDAIKAQQDEERYVNQAQAYARKHIPIAEGNATRILEEAKGYREQVILLARGETARFAKLLPEYKLNPQVLRDRLYLDTMREVYSNTPKVVMNAQGNNNVSYLPLDKIMQAGRARPAKTAEQGGAHKAAAPSSASGEAKKASTGRLTYEDIERIKYTRNNGGA
jgi:membrane protease subunit HflK